MALDVPLSRLKSRTRGTKDVARCRQVAMYLAVTTFSVPMSEVSAHFGRDRSTISHALAKIEDERDEQNGDFEVLMLQLEAMLGLTRDVWEQRAGGRF
ncbi:MAG: helix-turn-helix domain-containing protein [Pseudomonadota bacterium]